jgi:hypothetical protein
MPPASTPQYFVEPPPPQTPENISPEEPRTTITESRATDSLSRIELPSKRQSQMSSRPSSQASRIPLPDYELKNAYYQHITLGQYQYSRCNGRKKALVIGISYKYHLDEDIKPLIASVNDVHNVVQFLMSVGFESDDITVLLDQEGIDRRLLPTHDNIITQMEWLIRNAKRDDSLFFYFTGHGVQVEDKDGDEVDGLDEAILPMDFDGSNYILDDRMHDILVKPLPQGTRLTAVFDCCHSGTALDLPWRYDTNGKQVERPNKKQLLRRMGAAGFRMFKKNHNTIRELGKAIADHGTRSHATDRSFIAKSAQADVVMLSATKDDSMA